MSTTLYILVNDTWVVTIGRDETDLIIITLCVCACPKPRWQTRCTSCAGAKITNRFLLEIATLGRGVRHGFPVDRPTLPTAPRACHTAVPSHPHADSVWTRQRSPLCRSRGNNNVDAGPSRAQNTLTAHNKRSRFSFIS